MSYFGSYDIVNSSVKAPVFQQFHKPVLPQINLAKNNQNDNRITLHDITHKRTSSNLKFNLVLSLPFMAIYYWSNISHEMDIIRGICVLKIFGSVGGELLYVQQASCKINDHRTLIMTWLESRCAKMENCNDLLITFGNNGFDMQKLAQKRKRCRHRLCITSKRR